MGDCALPFLREAEKFLSDSGSDCGTANITRGVAFIKNDTHENNVTNKKQYESTICLDPITAGWNQHFIKKKIP